jgi:hypothetical protein
MLLFKGLLFEKYFFYKVVLTLDITISIVDIEITTFYNNRKTGTIF